MGEDNEKKVQRGERLQIPASTWNLFVDSIKAFKRNRGSAGAGGNPSSTVSPNNTILIRKTGGAAFHRSFHVQGIRDSLIDPTAVGNNSRTRPGVSTYDPSGDTDKICILQEPATDADVVKAAISGFSMCYVLINDDTHEWANPVNGENRHLESVECGGQARILYKTNPLIGTPDIADGVKLAFVNLIGAVACAGGASEPTYDVRLGEVTSSSDNVHSVKELEWNGTDIVPVSPTVTLTNCHSVTQTAVPVKTEVVLFKDPRHPTQYFMVPVWYGATLLGRVREEGDVQQLTWGTGGIGDSTPAPYTQCRATTGDTLPPGCYVTIDQIPDAPLNYWIMPAGYASIDFPGFVSIVDQTWKGNKTFHNFVVVNNANNQGVPWLVKDGVSPSPYNRISAAYPWTSIASLDFKIFGGATVSGSASTLYGLIDANASIRLAKMSDTNAVDLSSYWSTTFFTNPMPAAKGPSGERWQCGLITGDPSVPNTVNQLLIYGGNNEWVPFDGTDDGDMLIWNPHGSGGWQILSGTGAGAGDGTYTLKCTVVSGVRTYAWINDAGP